METQAEVELTWETNSLHEDVTLAMALGNAEKQTLDPDSAAFTCKPAAESLVWGLS